MACFEVGGVGWLVLKWGENGLVSFEVDWFLFGSNDSL